MTSRQRLFSVLSREIPDRVPVSFFIQEEFLSELYPEKESVNRMDDAVAAARYFGFDVMTRESQWARPYWLKDSYPDWEVATREWVEGDICFRETAIKTPEAELKQLEEAPYNPRTVSGVRFHKKDHFLKTPEDFAVFRKYFPEENTESLARRRKDGEYARQIIGEAGISAPWGAGGVFNQVSNCRNLQDLMMDPYLNPEFYRELMEFFTGWITEDYLKMADTDYDALGVLGNIANASLIGESFFREFILPYEKRIVDTIRTAGKYSIYHNCGVAGNLYPCYRDLGMDVWETVAPSPMGDNNMADAKAFFGTSLILSGNLDQVDFLKRASTDEVVTAVREIVEAGKPGGAFIFAASDFLEAGTPEENVRAAVEAAVRYGGYC